MGTNVKPSDNIGGPLPDGKKSEKHEDRTSDTVVLAVFFAKLQAFSGRGNLAALLRHKSGKTELHGVTNLAKIGLLDESHMGRTMKPDKLADLLGGVKVIRGRAACVAFLSDNKVTHVKPSHILGDVTGRAASGSDKAGSAFGI